MKNQSHRRLNISVLHTLILVALIASSVMIAEPAPVYAAPGTTSSEGQPLKFDAVESAGTPLQKMLMRSIKERKILRLPAPAHVEYEYDVVSVPKQNKAAIAAVDQVAITGRTVLTFDSPEQAGYDKWPDWIVDDALPASTTGSVSPGDYNQVIRHAVEQTFPGYWKKFEFGFEPRTFILEETYEVFPQNKIQAETFAALADTHSPIAAEVLLGFTIPGPQINYIFNQKEVKCYFGICVTLAEAKARFDLDWAFGLRHPARVTLTTPDSLEAGKVYTLSSSFTTLDWNQADYVRFGVHPGRGKEFTWYYDFFLEIKAWILGNQVIDWAKKSNFDYSKDCSVPVGIGACAIPLETNEVLTPDQTGLKWSIFNIITIGIGLIQEPAISSKGVSANWEARQGDFISNSGQLNYSGLGADTKFGPVVASAEKSTDMHLKLSGFRYEFNNFVLSYSGSFHTKLFNYHFEPIIFHIYTFDLVTLSGGLHPSIGIHPGTEGLVQRTLRVTPGQPHYHTTTTIISDAPDPSEVDQTFTVSFTVTSPFGVPSGIVTVSVSGTPESCSEKLVGGSGSCQITLNTPGEYTLTATYAGGGGFLPSSGNESHTVTRIEKKIIDIDIRSGIEPNNLYCQRGELVRRGVFDVVIITTESFDATTVDHSTVTFEGASEIHYDRRTGELRRHELDVDGDSDIDLRFHFRLGETDLTCDSTEGTLIGKTFDGQAIQGIDSVRMVNYGR